MRRSFRLLPILALFLAACGGGNPVAQTPTEAPTTAVEPTAVVEPTAEASPTPEATPTAEVVDLSNVEIAEKLRPSTVLVLAQFAETPIDTEGIGGGTGIMYDMENGYIITNAHVVEGASSVQVATANSNRARPARVLGRSQCDDLAILKVENTADMEAAALNSDKVVVGEEVVALGYPESFDLGNDLTVTDGTISRVNAQRDKYEELIQTDTAITHGNSGGPLVNRSGEVVGINTLGFYTADGEREPNINFAIAMSQAKPIIDALQEGKSRQFIGLNLYPNVFEDYFGTQDGLVVVGVASGSTASQVGVQPADLLLKLEGSSVNSEQEVCNILRSHGDGDQLRAQFLRASTGEILEGEMTMGKTGAADSNTARLAVVGSVAGGGDDQSGGEEQAPPTDDGSSEAETAVAEDGGTGDVSIVLASNFDSDTGDWPVGDDPAYAASVIDGIYQMELRSPQQYLTTTPDKAANMTDGAISTELQITDAEGYGGVMMRYSETDDQRSMYVCWINNNGQYGCSKAINNEWTVIVEPTSDDIIKKNDVNRVTMAIIGNAISFDVNDKEVVSITDDSLASGGTGFYIENFDNPATVRFDNAAIVAP